MSKQNKVKFNLKNVHWAKLTFSESDVPAFGEWHKWPGAVSLSLDPEGDTTPFCADGIVYYQSAANNGYSGDYESALVPEDFRRDILGEELDAHGVFVERADVETAHFALGYQLDGDQRGDRCILYNCTLARPGIGGSTIESAKEPETDSVEISATPMPDTGRVKARTSSETSPAVYASWFLQVYYGDAQAASVDLMELTIQNAALSPAFDPAVVVYTADTAEAEGEIMAVPYGDAAAEVRVNGSDVPDGTAAAWQDGKNTVVVLVSDGGQSKAYTVTVTKTGG